MSQSSKIGLELLKEWRSHGPYRCWVCGSFPASPHHIHNQHDKYWFEEQISPHQPFNIRPLCHDCHAKVKHILGEIILNHSPWRKERRKARVEEFFKEFPGKKMRELVPKWVLTEISMGETPDVLYQGVQEAL